MLSLVVTVALSLLAVLVIHEAGHAIAAWAFGGRRVRLRLRPWGAAIEAELPERRVLAFVLAGPLVSALSGVALLAVGGIFAVPGVLSVAFAALSLVPHGTNDGARALSLLRASSSKPARPRG